LTGSEYHVTSAPISIVPNRRSLPIWDAVKTNLYEAHAPRYECANVVCIVADHNPVGSDSGQFAPKYEYGNR
jgi:hypothetical protein